MPRVNYSDKYTPLTLSVLYSACSQVVVLVVVVGGGSVAPESLGMEAITPSLGLSPPPFDTSNKNTADIKSPYSKRADIISFVDTCVIMNVVVFFIISRDK